MNQPGHARVLFGFETADERPDQLPMAARRALAEAGLALSDQQWLQLDASTRASLARLGASDSVDPEQVRLLVAAHATDAPRPAPLPFSSPPDALLRALGSDRPLADAVWAGLHPLERFALVHLADSPEALALAYAELVGATAASTHLLPSGEARMVDVAAKPITSRRAVATSFVRMQLATLQRLASAPKGDVMAAARIAGIMAAKKTAELIPLCHPVATTRVQVELQPVHDPPGLRVTAAAEALDRTGVEMEAMVAASVAALTVYDMLKGVERGITIEQVRLELKEGGRSGPWQRDS
jgi:cyclic pyranopterin phosphate synthase